MRSISIALPAQPPRAARIGARLMPFAPLITSVLITLVGLFLGPPPAEPFWFVLGVAIWFLVAAAAVWIPWRSLRLGGQLIPALLYLVGTVILRHGLGGAESGFGALALIPIIWLGLFGTRSHVVIGIVALAVMLAAPVLLIGGSMYPESEWRRLITLVLVGGFAGLSINGLVTAGRLQALRLRERTRELADQIAVTRAVVEAADDAVVSFDESGRIVRWNTAAAAMLGWSDGSMVGRNIFQAIVAPNDRARIEEGFGRLLAAIAGHAAVHPELDPGDVLSPEGVEALAAVEQVCIADLMGLASRIDGLFPVDPLAAPGWAEAFAASTAGGRGTAVPLLVQHGTADGVVRYGDSEVLVDRLCGLGATVVLSTYEGDDHGAPLFTGADEAVAWLTDRVAGRPAPSSC
jgi:PAS domain-containing protein